ncbi:hypothetical protein P168DRAFT_328110 [Aspergillus campestris IBT 28561]|uniref:Uncharacterized protein n=1 Tax=Aspergillus campestris (strain IBT 28561) TaxID=1392248 RepID=A0A2I1CZG6_ASPC2|nr:uncharacterized protein P168DRAFT_328110 [Aspergillus campestris IBT 28561]PKY03015.1 hypothetical protein P168DRAFT_328110 [Aspergillus campestris IBT 28561]
MSELAWSEDQLTSVLLSTLDADPNNQEELSRYQPALDAFANSKPLEELEVENEGIWKEYQAQSSTSGQSADEANDGIKIPSTEELISRYNWTQEDVERGYKGGPVKFQYFENPDSDGHNHNEEEIVVVEKEVDVISIASSVESPNDMIPTNSSTDSGQLPETATIISSSPAGASTISSMSTPTDYSMLSDTGTNVSSFTRASTMISTDWPSESSLLSESASSISSSPSSVSSMVSTVSRPSDSSELPESTISADSSPAQSPSATSTPSDSSELPAPDMSVNSSPAQSARATGPANLINNSNQLPAPALSTSSLAQSIRSMLLANYQPTVPTQRPLPDISTYHPPQGTLAPMDILLDPTKLRAPYTFRAAAQPSKEASMDLPTRPAQPQPQSAPMGPPTCPAQLPPAQQQPSTPTPTIYSSPAPRAQTIITTPNAPGALPSPLLSASTPKVPAQESPCVARAARKRRAAAIHPTAVAPPTDNNSNNDDKNNFEPQMGIERFLMQAFPDEVTPLQKRRVLNASPLGERIRYCRAPTADMAYGGRKLSVRSLRGMIFAARLAEARRVEKAARAARAARCVVVSAQGAADQDVTMVDV